MHKCFICKKKFTDKNELFTHYESEHEEDIPQDWSGAKYHFYRIHGRVEGKCPICGKPTGWNDKTNRPFKFCKDPNCVKEYRKQFEQRMINAHGKVTLLDDPEVQKKMLFSRKISGVYKWSTGETKKYVGSYEKDALQFFDRFMGYPAEDILTPAPQIVDYEYEGKTHFYIPDIYIASINTVIEIKDGGDNPNTHPKIMAVDKVKEKLKDEAIKKLGVNYIKLTDKKYGKFLDFLADLKFEESKERPRNIFITESMLNCANYDIMYMVIFENNITQSAKIAFSFESSLSNLYIVDINENGAMVSYTCNLKSSGLSGRNVRVYRVSGDSLMHNFNYAVDSAVNKNNNPIGNLEFSIKFLNDFVSEEPRVDLYDMVNNDANIGLLYSGNIDKFSIENIVSESFNELQECIHTEVLAPPEIIIYDMQDDFNKVIEYKEKFKELYNKLQWAVKVDKDDEFKEIFEMLLNARTTLQMEFIRTKINSMPEVSSEMNAKNLSQLFYYKYELVKRLVNPLDISVSHINSIPPVVKSALSENFGWYDKYKYDIMTNDISIPLLSEMVIGMKKLLENTDQINIESKLLYFGQL